MKRPRRPPPTAADAIGAILGSRAFAEAMTLALTRKPARDASELARMARRVLTKNMKADVDAVQLVVTWDRVRKTNVITAEMAPVGDP